MKKCIKICISATVSILFLIACGLALAGDLAEWQLKYGTAGGIALYIFAILFFASLNILILAPNVGLFFFMEGEFAGWKRKIVCLILTVIIYPVIMLLIKPATVSIGQYLSTEMVYGKWYKSGLAPFNLSEVHSYPALKIFAGELNLGWLIGFLLIVVFVLVITTVNRAMKRFDEQYKYDFDHVERKAHLEITDKVTRTGIIAPKVQHDIKTKVVDDTEYPIHSALIACALLALGVIFTPYITFLTLIVRQLI